MKLLLVAIGILCSSYPNVLYSYIILTVLDFIQFIAKKYRYVCRLLFSFLLVCASVLQSSCWSVFCLTLMLTGCLGPLALMLFQAASTPILQLISSLTIETFCLKQEWMWVRIKINKDWLYDENDLHSELLNHFWLTQRPLRCRPSEVKLDVQLVIFTLDINALSVET